MEDRTKGVTLHSSILSGIHMWVALGALHVSPNLGVWSSSIGHGFNLEGRESPSVATESSI